MSQRDKLLDLEKTEKYLFHGSGNSGIDIMDPRQAFNYVNGVQEKDGEPSVFPVIGISAKLKPCFFCIC